MHYLILSCPEVFKFNINPQNLQIRNLSLCSERGAVQSCRDSGLKGRSHTAPPAWGGLRTGVFAVSLLLC